MKKLYAAITILAISLSVGVTAMAQGKMSGKSSQKAGCASCQKGGATPEQMKKFKADSIDLRQEMMNKRFDLQRENQGRHGGDQGQDRCAQDCCGYAGISVRLHGRLSADGRQLRHMQQQKRVQHVCRLRLCKLQQKGKL